VSIGAHRVGRRCEKHPGMQQMRGSDDQDNQISVALDYF
jgi:hypothetical protein